MLTAYQIQLQRIRNKEIPSSAVANKISRKKSLFVKNVAALSYQLLLKQTQLVFNAWIRKRDKDKGCVSCKSKKVLHASHYYPAGSFAGLRFHEHNAHGSCEECNTFLYGNLQAYRKELSARIGSKSLTELDQLAYVNKRKKYSRNELLVLIDKYK